MIDAILILIVVFVAAAVLRPVLMMLRQRERNARAARHAGARPRHEWEPRTDRLYRRAVGVQRPGEDREGILAFVTSRRAVEAYMEPKTVMNPLSVVLVAADGEWRRFELGDDSYLRELTHTHGLPVLDAMRTGYPERMRRYRRTQKGEPT